MLFLKIITGLCLGASAVLVGCLVAVFIKLTIDLMRD